MESFSNPFRPGAGHPPPYLAGRDDEQREFTRLLGQSVILDNILLTGLRGVGKTVLLETIKPIAQAKRWLWVGQDMSQYASVSESSMAERLITDLSVLTANLLVTTEKQPSFGFTRSEIVATRPVGYEDLKKIFETAPGLIADKLKAVLLFVWRSIPVGSIPGIVFAYDEAQNLADHPKKEQYPLSILLDIFQSLQRMRVPYLLILSGLPTIFPKLVEARTYTERMFHTIFLTKLDEKASRLAITVPVKKANCPVTFTTGTVDAIISMSGGYPYFIQLVCREIFDAWIANIAKGKEPTIPHTAIIKKLDEDFFVGRWSNATDRQRQLMHVISTIATGDEEFTVQEIGNASKEMLQKPFSASQVNQYLAALGDMGFVFKNRYGKYSFAVPLLSEFIKRQILEGYEFPTRSA
jgi:AAA ATPase domain